MCPGTQESPIFKYCLFAPIIHLNRSSPISASNVTSEQLHGAHLQATPPVFVKLAFSPLNGA